VVPEQVGYTELVRLSKESSTSLGNYVLPAKLHANLDSFNLLHETEEHDKVVKLEKTTTVRCYQIKTALPILAVFLQEKLQLESFPDFIYSDTFLQKITPESSQLGEWNTSNVDNFREEVVENYDILIWEDITTSKNKGGTDYKQQKASKEKIISFLQSLHGTGVVSYTPLPMVVDSHDRRKLNHKIQKYMVPQKYAVWSDDSTWDSIMNDIRYTELNDTNDASEEEEEEDSPTHVAKLVSPGGEAVYLLKKDEDENEWRVEEEDDDEVNSRANPTAGSVLAVQKYYKELREQELHVFVSVTSLATKKDNDGEYYYDPFVKFLYAVGTGYDEKGSFIDRQFPVPAIDPHNDHTKVKDLYRRLILTLIKDRKWHGLKNIPMRIDMFSKEKGRAKKKKWYVNQVSLVPHADLFLRNERSQQYFEKIAEEVSLFIKENQAFRNRW
jgi:hypothetical protein